MVPGSPESRDLDPLISVWPAGQPIFRIHNWRYPASAFNPGLGRGRFHPFRDSSGQVVPTLYGADSLDGALSETVFRAVPVSGPGRRVLVHQLVHLRLSILTPRRSLHLAALYGFGLGRLGLERRDLIDTEASLYDDTVPWAAALHAAPQTVDGIEWVSRQHDASRALLLFGDRVDSNELELQDGPLRLDRGVVWNRVVEAAEASGILLLT